jgi:hypothetical protein
LARVRRGKHRTPCRASTRARLEAAGVPFREASYAQLDIHQIVVHDPDGVKVELNFKGQAA